MDFASYIRDQSAKLNSLDYVKILWDEIEGNPADKEAPLAATSEYVNHLPVLLEQFWDAALEKLHTSDPSPDDFDQDLQVYLLVLIYQTITQSQESISNKCVISASQVYLKLLCTPLGEDIFKSRLYRGVVGIVQVAIEASSSSDQVLVRVMHRLRKFLIKSRLLLADLEVTLASLVHIVFLKTNCIISSFDPEPTQSIASEALLSLGALLSNEQVPTRKYIITSYLFNGLRKSNVIHQTPHSFSLVQANFRNLLRSLNFKFKEDNYKTFMNAFLHVWSHPDFTFYSEAILIMNNLHEKQYETLIDVLNKMLTSKSVHKNHFRLSLAIVCNPYKQNANDKTKVNNEILIRNVLLNCLSNKNDISSAAVEAMAELLMSPDLQKEYVMEAVKKIFNPVQNSSFLSVPTILRGLQSLAGKKWSGRSRNKPLFGIMISIMLLSESDYPEIYHEILDLTEDASPFDLKPYLSTLFELYQEMDARNHQDSALKVLKVIFKMALHPMASSSEFVKQLYNTMVFSNSYRRPTVKSKIYIDPIITEDFNYREFFEKCHALNLIKRDHVGQLIANIRQISDANLKFLGAVVSFTEYKELAGIAGYINENFMTECNNPNLNSLLHVYAKILKNNCNPSDWPQAASSNEIMVAFLKHHLVEQAFRWDAVANAFSLLKNLGAYTNLQQDFQILKQEYDNKLRDTLDTNGSFLPLHYFSQLVVFGKMMPDDANIAEITRILRQCSDETFRRSEAFNGKIWIGCLLLYTNMCVMRNSLVETGLDFLQIGLNSPITAVKLASINMTFDLCNMVTHNFEDLIKFMFQQLIGGDNAFKRTCLVKIDRLIRDDYLKLELEQYLILGCILGDRTLGLGDYLTRLLSEHFFVSNTAVITKYFVPFIVHINGYKKHPVYRLGVGDQISVQVVAEKVVDRRKIYSLLLGCLPVKCKFGIVYTLSAHILDHLLKGTIKLDQGYWNMIKDAIFVYKQITLMAIDADSDDDFCKKVLGKISKHLVDKTECPEKPNNIQYHKEIQQATTTLLKLMFYNDRDNAQIHIRGVVFDAIIYWTDFLLADLSHLIHADRCKEIQNFYVRFESYCKKNSVSLNTFRDGCESS